MVCKTQDICYLSLYREREPTPGPKAVRAGGGSLEKGKYDLTRHLPQVSSPITLGQGEAAVL